MITRSNLAELLRILGFRDERSVFRKSFNDSLYLTIEVDFKAEKIIYPEAIKINDATTCNFAHPENFVVLECVVRLLGKGYRPEHIELEKRWNLGHDSKGGKADICVCDESGNMLLIIECKTYGSKYSDAKKELIEDGGQLFSYWQQERHTKWLALYASDLKDGEIVFENDIINCSDDNNLLLLAEKDETIKLFKNAGTVEEKFTVWRETYGQAFYQKLIFGPDTVAYQIGVKPLRKKDLRDFTPEDRIVNRFEEILRHNNVSDKENAFNRLVALFICKLVDEIGKDDDAELEFQYKQGIDTYETLQDRLQKLHQKGMNDFMKEKIFYVPNDYAEKLVQQYSGQRRRAMIEELQNTIRILKFYTNNDFSFKDVHNEELFYQNGKVVVEVVQLFENYRIVYPSKHQFLGDLFEQLLNKGFKQNEGQFFTPMPITRFIWDALPLDDIIKGSGKYTLPKIIDYACGAGHFLTEAVEAVNAALARHNQVELARDNGWVEKNIYGIEKDYRLARVSKISLFMNGAGYGNIIFGDGLDNYPEKQVESGTFDILVANPPYAVKGFKVHFKPKSNQFILLDNISNEGSEIEVLFVERIAQLLKPEGIAAVILPASILCTSSSSYVGARETILENFKICAIAQFGNKTFGATGTTTVVLFLEKYSEPPKRKELVADSVAAIQGGRDLTDWEDGDILQAYLDKIEVPAEDYKLMLEKDMPLSHWADHAYFGQFVRDFLASTDVKNKLKQKSFQKTSPEAQEQWLKEHFYKFLIEKERDKIKYFALVYSQETLVVTAPSGNDEQKEFLGYDWSNRKGAEGIQIQQLGGKLYADSDRTACRTIAANIRRAFSGQHEPFLDLGQYLAWYRLQDLIDFSRVKFNKEIRTSVVQQRVVSSKYPVGKLGNIAAIEKGTAITQAESKPGKIKVVAGGLDYAYMHNKANRESGVITVSASGANAGFVNFWDEPIFASDCTTVAGKTRTETLFIFYYLRTIQDYIHSLAHGADQVHVNAPDLEQIVLPLPPPDVQQQVVSECQKIDSDMARENLLLRKDEKKIMEIFEDTQTKPSRSYRLDDEALFEILIGNRVLNSELVKDGTIPVYSANVNEPFGYMTTSCLSDFSRPSVLWGIDGDWMTGYIPENVAFNPTDHCGVIRVLSPDISAKYLSLALYRMGQLARFTRSMRPSIDRIKSLSVNLPLIDIQQDAVVQILKLEQEMLAAKKILASAEQKKKEIVERFLN